MLELPIFLYQLFYTVFASAIPLLLLLWIVRVITKSGRKTKQSFTK